METDSYTPGPASSDWLGTVAGLEGMGVLQEHEGGGLPSSPASWYTPYSLGFQVSLTSFLMLELVLGFSSNLTVLVLYFSQSNLVDSVSNMVTVNLHVLDVAVCVLCLPLTLVIVLLPPGPNLALLCCFHEACVTFASISTAINILVISLDRYDISVRPANRLLTTRRATLLLAAVWVTSVAVFFIPFLEVQWSSGEGAEERGKVTRLSLSSHGISSTVVPAWRNQTLLCVGGQDYHTGLGMYFHLILQVPIFFTTVAVMLFTYSRILRALNIRIGSHMKKGQQFRGPHKRQKKKVGLRMNNSGGEVGGEQCTTDGTKQLSHPPLIPSSSPTPTATSPPALSSSAPLVTSDTGAATAMPTTSVQASVSAIIALRRAVRRHRDRRERQRRVFKMSLIIITTFLGCWAPLSVTNMLILGIGPSDALVSLRLWFLALAYGTTVSHPLLYAFTRQKLRRALRAKVKKRVVSLLQVDPSPGGTIIHNSWVENRKSSRQVRLEASKGTDRCLAEGL
ncbi:G-protein coupled receptor 22-like [Sander vitreus]